MDRCTHFYRAVAGITIAALGLAGCVKYRWRNMAWDKQGLAHHPISKRKVRFTYDTGSVTLSVRGVAYPFVEGSVDSANGAVVAVDLGRVRKVETVKLDAQGRELSRRTIQIDKERWPSLVSQTCSFLTEDGPVVLAVDRVEPPFAFGRPYASPGRVRLDLREVRLVEVHEVAAGQTAMATVGLVTGAFAALVVTAIATKGDFCPVVYMDGEPGMDLVGEAFPGAVARSVERRDVQSLPRPRSGSVHVRMVDEARQTQYVDEVTLLVAEHPADLRALVAPDRGIVLVGAAGAATSVFDELGHDAAPLLTARDGRVWQTDLAEAASGAPLRDELTATFAAPSVGTPVLEIVGGNTEWLELVLGQVARAMGDQIPRYRALGDRPEGAVWIASWRERQHLDLSIDAFMAGTWHRVATVPSPGAAALRHVAVPLPGQLAASGTLRVRLSSGEGFWRIDQLALSVLSPSLPAMRRLAPRSATGVAGRDERGAIADADGRYALLEDLGSALDLRFDVAPPEAGTSQSLFLSSRGYYERHAALEGRSSPELLARLADENGSLGRLSRDLAREYLERWTLTQRTMGTARR